MIILSGFVLARLGIFLALSVAVSSSHVRHGSNLRVARDDNILARSAGRTIPSSVDEPFKTSGDAAVSSIQDIQEGLSDLPRNLLAFVQAVQDRLDVIEAMLHNLQPGQSPVASAVTSAPSHAVSTGPIGTAYPMTATNYAPSGTGTPNTASSTVLWPNSTAPMGTTPTGRSEFDPQSTSNVAVYYGGSAPANEYISLSYICNRYEVDVVVLQALFSFEGANIKSMWLRHCTSEDQDTNCISLRQQVLDCQKAGKKVLLSIGQNVAAHAPFSTDEEAIELAGTFWRMFGGGDGLVRPFGEDVRLDGFEITRFCTTDECRYPESNPPPWHVFASTMRTMFAQDSSKPYFIASAPSCDPAKNSIPINTFFESDWIWPQFWNEPSCELNKNNNNTRFLSALDLWSMNLKNTPLESATKPRLYIGMAAYDGFPDIRGGGFVEYGFDSTMRQVRCLNLTNFGGTMLYDGAEAIAHTGRHGSALSQIWSAVKGSCYSFCLFGPANEEFCKQVASQLHTGGGL